MLPIVLDDVTRVGLGLAGDLIFTFPVTCVDVLSKGLKVLKVSGLACVANLVFDLVRETSIEFMMEGSFPIAMKLRAETIELNEVADDVMSFLHTKVVKVGTKLAQEFCEELIPVVHPQGTLVGSNIAEQVRFEPFQSHTFQVGLSEGNFRLVFVEGPRMVLKIQLALDEKSVELFHFSTVKSIGFVDLGL